MSIRKEKYFYQEGCYIEEWLNNADNPAMSVAQVRVEPGKATQLHSLKDTVERYVILAGSARVTVGDKQWHVTAKDVVQIAANVPQCIQNLEQSNLVFLAICSPRFELANYVDLGKNKPS